MREDEPQRRPIARTRQPTDGQPVKPDRHGGGEVRRAAQLSRRQRSRRPPSHGVQRGRQPSIAFFLSASYSGTVIAPESLSWLSFSIWSAGLTPAAAFCGRIGLGHHLHVLGRHLRPR